MHKKYILYMYKLSNGIFASFQQIEKTIMFAYLFTDIGMRSEFERFDSLSSRFDRLSMMSKPFLGRFESGLNPLSLGWDRSLVF